MDEIQNVEIGQKISWWQIVVGIILGFLVNSKIAIYIVGAITNPMNLSGVALVQARFLGIGLYIAVIAGVLFLLSAIIYRVGVKKFGWLIHSLYPTAMVLYAAFAIFNYYSASHPPACMLEFDLDLRTNCMYTALNQMKNADPKICGPIKDNFQCMIPSIFGDRNVAPCQQLCYQNFLPNSWKNSDSKELLQKICPLLKNKNLIPKECCAIDLENNYKDLPDSCGYAALTPAENSIMPTLLLTTPNSGTFNMNDKISIQWTTNLPNSSVSLNLQSQDSTVFCQLPYVTQNLAGPGSYNFIPANTVCINNTDTVHEKIVPGIYRINMTIYGGQNNSLSKDVLGGWFTVK